MPWGGLPRIAPVPHRDDARYREAERAAWAHRGLEPEEAWVDVADLGIRMRALVVGLGRPVLFVHGNPTTGNVFIPLVAALEGVRAIVIDRPGCGLSEPLSYAEIGPEELRAAVVTYLSAVVDHLVGAPVDVVGNSAGGGAVLMLAADRPDLVRTLTLEGVPAVRGMRLPRAMLATSVAPIAELVARYPVSERDLRRSFRAMGHGALVDAGGLEAQDLDWRIALARDTETLRNELALVRRAATWRGTRPGWFPGREILEAISAPSLWVVGDRDPFASPARVRAWAAHVPGSTVRVMKDSGHQPWLDAPAEHARLLTAFWEAASER